VRARDGKNNCYVVIELKKNQTSDDTIGQVTRYMGWIKDKKGDSNVKGIIIAAEFDQKLEYALKVIPNIQVLLYRFARARARLYILLCFPFQFFSVNVLLSFSLSFLADLNFGSLLKHQFSPLLSCLICQSSVGERVSQIVWQECKKILSLAHSSVLCSSVDFSCQAWQPCQTSTKSLLKTAYHSPHEPQH
jgi:hypothetical protein